ncbi:MAG: hypothetical protein AAFX53_10570 [Bacteroidota bacterium]
MKRTQLIVLALVTVGFIVSCDDDGGTSTVPLEDGAVPNLVRSADAPAFIDLIQLNAGEPVNLAYSVEVAQGNPASTDIIGVYTVNPADGGAVYTADLANDVTLPQDFTLTANDIIAAFSELNSADDIKLGDVLAISTRFTMDDGRVLDVIPPTVEGNTSGTRVPVGGTGTNIATTVLFTTVINYPVSCPSALGGAHTFVSTDLVAANSPSACPTGEVTGTVTWTDQGGGTYLTSDLGFGQYESSCWSDGPATSGAATFREVCGEIISGGADQYGLIYTWVITDVSGSELTMTWTNDYADSGTVVITREGGADWPDLFTN